MTKYLLALALATGSYCPADDNALVITTPVDRIVYQRNNANQAVIPITGTCPKDATKVEARLIPRDVGVTTSPEWTVIDKAPKKGKFRGALTRYGGWYILEVRAFVGKPIIATTYINHVGVGEVFIAIGHSVAQGGDVNLEGATDERVITVPMPMDDKSVETHKTYKITGDLQYLPPPVFAVYGTGVRPAPFGVGPYFWAKFAELVVQKENVPVLIYNAAFGGTTLEQWAKSSQGVLFEHSFVRAPIRMPYINLHNALKKYIPLTGVRALLADQGQNDAGQKDENVVFENFQTFVAQARKDFGYPHLAVVVNRQTPGLRDTQIRKAQERMIATPDCFPGPDYDTLAVEDRPDNIHLGPTGLSKAAAMWAEALDANFYKSSKPWLPTFKP